MQGPVTAQQDQVSQQAGPQLDRPFHSQEGYLLVRQVPFTKLNCRVSGPLSVGAASNIQLLFFLQAPRQMASAAFLYRSGAAMLIGGEQQPSAQVICSLGTDTEHSANSQGSHETGDSGRFSHESNEELHPPPGFGAADSFPGSNSHLTTSCPVPKLLQLPLAASGNGTSCREQ